MVFFKLFLQRINHITGGYKRLFQGRGGYLVNNDIVTAKMYIAVRDLSHHISDVIKRNNNSMLRVMAYFVVTSKQGWKFKSNSKWDGMGK